MAIYNNREVWLNTDIKWVKKLPDQVSVRDRDGQTYTVNSSAIRFTKDEIKNMQVEENDPLNTLPEATEEDLKAVRLGVPSANDPELKAQAATQVHQEERQKVVQENLEKAKAESKKAWDKALGDVRAFNTNINANLANRNKK